MDAYQLTSSDHQTCSCPQAWWLLVFGHSAVLHVKSILLFILDCSIRYLDTKSQTNWKSNVLKVARNYLNNEDSGLLWCDIMFMGKWFLAFERNIHSSFMFGVKQTKIILLGNYWMTVASTLDRWQWGSEQCQWQQICEVWSSRVCSQLRCLQHNDSFMRMLLSSEPPSSTAWPLTLRLLMSYIHGAPIPDVSRSHTMQHSR